METRTCPICKEVAKQALQTHYGGVACFSCRAFFRRAHQKTKSPEFACKKGGQCEVHVKTRRKCQKCRYDLCLAVGMKPEAVLTDDQKKARFRNSLKKKATTSYTTDQDIAEETVCPDMICKAPLKKRLKLMSSFDDGAEDEAKRVEAVVRSYNLSCIQMNTEPAFRAALLKHHKMEGLMTSRKLLLDHVSVLVHQFRHFALMQPDFLSLPASDRRKLLAKNAPLYVQFVLARYFSSKTGQEQIMWLVGPQKLSEEDEDELCKVSLKKLNAAMRLFDARANLADYGACIKSIRRHGTVTNFPLLCLLLLFQTEPSMVFEDPFNVHQNFAYASRLLAAHGDSEDKPSLLTDVIADCEKMAQFFAQHVSWSEEPQPEEKGALVCYDTALEFVPRYTIEEEKWLNYQLKSLVESTNAVCLGDDFMNNLISRAQMKRNEREILIPETLSVFGERTRRVMKMHAEYNDLTVPQQNKIWKKNYHFGLALAVAKLESCQLLHEQFLSAVGMEDTKVMDAEYSSKLRKFKAISMISNNFYAPSEEMELERLFKSIGRMVKDDTTFRLFWLLLVFSQLDKKSMPKLVNLRSKYLNVVMRRQVAKGNLDDSLFFRKFNVCLKDVRKLAVMLKSKF